MPSSALRLRPVHSPAAGRTAASPDDEGVSLIIARLPMEDPQCGRELDPMAVTNRLPFRGLPLWRRTHWTDETVDAQMHCQTPR